MNTYTTIIIVTILSIVTSSSAKDFYSQNKNLGNNLLLETKPTPIKKLSLDFDLISIREIFRILNHYAGIKYSIDKEIQNEISLNVNDVSLETALKIIQETAEVSIRKVDDIYMVSKKSNAGCNYNGVYYSEDSIRSSNGLNLVCKRIEKSTGDFYSREQKLSWVNYAN